MSIQKNLDSIKSNSLFKGVDFKSLNFPFDAKYFVEIKEGELIYSAGQPADFIYLLVNGEVKVKSSLVKRLFFKSSNDFFGDLEFLGNTERNSSVLANSDCVLYKIDSELLSRLLNDSSSVRANLLFDRNSDSEKGNTIVEQEEPVGTEPTIDLNADTIKIDIAQAVDVKPKYQTSIDIDKIKVKHYEQVPDLDSFIQQKYLENDNKSLKTQLVGDPDDVSNWIITEQPLEVMPSKKEIIVEQTEKKVLDQDILIKSNIPNPKTIDTDKYKELIPSSDIKQTSKEILEFLLEKTDSNVGAIFLFSSKNQMLEEIYQTNESIQKGKKSIKEGITGLVAKEKAIRFAVSFLNDINYNQEVDRPNGFVGETLIFIPFVDDNNNLLGLVQIGTNEVMFTKTEENRIRDHAKYCSKILLQSLNLKPNIEISSKSDLNQISNFIMQDLKAPLLTVKHYSSILSRFDLPEEVKKVITSLSSQTNYIIDLLQASIDFSEKNTKNKLEVINYDEALNQILVHITDYVESRNVKLLKKLDCEAKVKIDIRRFFVACYYISRFACDVMTHGGSINFTSQLNGANAVLTIKNENRFINANNLEMVFDPSFHNDNDQVIGLSLAISKFIIESMKGTIKVQLSDSGTCYLVSIPILS